jgi:hypothetical protein
MAKEKGWNIKLNTEIDYVDPYVGRFGVGGTLAFKEEPGLVFEKTLDEPAWDFKLFKQRVTGPNKISGYVKVFEGIKTFPIYHDLGNSNTMFFGLNDSYYLAARFGRRR